MTAPTTDPSPATPPAHARPTPIAPEDVRLTWTETGPRLQRDGGDVPVRAVWARPLTARGAELSLVDEKKREHCFIPSLDRLTPDARAVIERAIEERYLIARIVRVLETDVHLGTRYWTVDTDRGPRRFAMREPRKNVHWLTPREHCLIRDTMGNRYEIERMSELDAASREAIDKVL